MPAEPPTAAEVIGHMHAGDPVAKRLGIELIAASDREVLLRMPIDERHLGGHGLGHGGTLFTLADVAMSYVSNRSNQPAVATGASIDFIDGVRLGDVVEARGTETSHRGRAAICDVSLAVGDRLVALFRGSTLRIDGAVTAMYQGHAPPGATPPGVTK